MFRKRNHDAGKCRRSVEGDDQAGGADGQDRARTANRRAAKCRAARFTVEFEPGARLRVHKHPYPHYVYVEKGTLTVMNVETGRSLTFKQGSFFVEMTNTWHYGINETNEPVKLLVIEQMPKNVATNTVLKPGQ